MGAGLVDLAEDVLYEGDFVGEGCLPIIRGDVSAEESVDPAK